MGRSAAARQFDPQAIKLAVVAHIRHTHTNYDEMLMQTDDRVTARAQIHGQLCEILDRWQQAGNIFPPK